MKTHIITHHDVDGLKSAAHILRLDNYANVILKERNKLSAKEFLGFAKFFKKDDFIFLIECDPTKEALKEIIKVSKKVSGLFFFSHYVTRLNKEEYNKLIKNVFCLFSGSFNQPTETVVRPFVKAITGEVSPTYKKFEKLLELKTKELQKFREKNNKEKKGWNKLLEKNLFY